MLLEEGGGGGELEEEELENISFKSIVINRLLIGLEVFTITLFNLLETYYHSIHLSSPVNIITGPQSIEPSVCRS